MSHRDHRSHSERRLGWSDEGCLDARALHAGLARGKVHRAEREASDERARRSVAGIDETEEGLGDQLASRISDALDALGGPRTDMLGRHDAPTPDPRDPQRCGRDHGAQALEHDGLGLRSPRARPTREACGDESRAVRVVPRRSPRLPAEDVHLLGRRQVGRRELRRRPSARDREGHPDPGRARGHLASVSSCRNASTSVFSVSSSWRARAWLRSAPGSGSLGSTPFSRSCFLAPAIVKPLP
jgi:hypothetical protein